MKRIGWIVLGILAAGILPRLPHPAVDVGKLEPVALVQITAEDTGIRVETDTGAWGDGASLSEAVEDLRQGADGIVFLDTADYLLLSGDVESYMPQIYGVIRPACKVCYVSGQPDLEEAARYLAIHPPEKTLGDLRAGKSDLQTLTLEGGRGGLAPS